MNRRSFIGYGITFGALGVLSQSAFASALGSGGVVGNVPIKKITRTDAEWKSRLTPELCRYRYATLYRHCDPSRQIE